MATGASRDVVADAPRQGLYRLRPIAFGVALLGSLALAYVALGQWQRARDVEQGLLSVPPARIVQAAACGFDNFLGDLFYMRFSTYWGYWLTHGRKYHNMYPLLDLITSLNPEFHPAYEVGALALADSGEIEQSVRLLDKGAALHPQDYWYPYQAGLMLFLYSNKYVLAAHYFDVASHKPDADPSAAYFEARMFNVARRRTDAIDEWIHIYLTGNKDMATVAANSLEKLYHIDPQWIDLYLSDNALGHRLAGRALLKAGVDLSVVGRDYAKAGLNSR